MIERCNDTRYGLAAAVCGKNYQDVLTIAHAVRAGTVWVNCYDVLEVRMIVAGSSIVNESQRATGSAYNEALIVDWPGGDLGSWVVTQC